ncbi:MAG: hypothetical protein ACOVVK_09455 [Elsteraceae bacterium]
MTDATRAILHHVLAPGLGVAMASAGVNVQNFDQKALIVALRSLEDNVRP